MPKTIFILLATLLLISKSQTQDQVMSSYPSEGDIATESGVTDDTFTDTNQLEAAAAPFTSDAFIDGQELDQEIDAHFDNEEMQELDDLTPPPQPTPIPIDSAALNPEDPNDELTKYFAISKTMKVHEDSYIACFEDLGDSDFMESEIDKCTGKLLVHVHNALDFEKRKVTSWADKSINKRFIEFCYKKVHENMSLSLACDLFREDCLQLLWNEMPMHSLLSTHRRKYTIDYARMPDWMMDNLLMQIKAVEKEYDSLNTEVEVHRETTVEKLKRYIRERSSDIVDRFNRGEYAKYPRIKIDHLEMVERLADTPDYKIDMSQSDRKLVGRKVDEDNLEVKEAKTTNRDFQAGFISDWNHPHASLKRGLRMNLDLGEMGKKENSVGVKGIGSRRRLKVDRFQFFGKH